MENQEKNYTADIWVEKYRPKSVSECILRSGIKNAFLSFVEKGEFPHLLLAGSAGIGKTTIAQALCNDLKLEMCKINASNDRGIDTLRTQIMGFASTVSLMGDGKVKVVLLDEADAASPLLQQALRSSMEELSKNCRFIFTCNYPQKIISPLHSRCTVIRLDEFGDETEKIKVGIMKRILGILKSENVEFDPACVAQLVEKFFPDFRRMLNELQRIASVSGKIDKETLQFSDENVAIKDLVALLKDKDFRGMRQWVGANSNMEPHVLFRKIYDILLDGGFLPKENIPNAVLIIAEYQYRAVQVVDQEINNAAFLTEIMSLM